MSTRSAPWQYEWKRPEWDTPTDESDFSIDGVPISIASAQVSSKEVDEWEKRPSPKDDTFPVYPVDDEDASLLLSATLYATDKQSSNPSGDVLFLELMKHKRNGAIRLTHRMLRWPGSTLDEGNTEKSLEGGKSWSLTSWFGKRPRRGVRLVSVSLCRLPPGEDLASASVDAMDVVALLSLGLDLNESSTAPSSPIAHATELEQADDDTPRDLVLACLTTDGRVLLYSPQKIFRPNAKEDQDGKLGDGLASLLLGSAIHQQLEQSVLPLSQPLVIIPLSVPLKHGNKKTVKSKNQHLDVIPESLVLPEGDDDDEEEEATTQELHLWEGSFWDANIEISTAKYHTLDNEPSLLVHAFEFLAVAGRGTRTRTVRRRRKTMSNSRGSSVSSWETASHQDEKCEVSAKTRLDTTDSNDPPAGWWEVQYENESQKGGTRLSGDDVSDRIKKRGKTRWVEYEETGGFITFLSLRYYAESRTIFLPFAPKQLSAVVWGGMHFVIVLGEESLAPRHTPIAMAIRVDSFDVVSFPQGEAPSYFTTSGSKEVKTSSKEDPTRDEKKKPKRKPMCTVRRFHLLPIILPSCGNSSKAVAISSTLTDPPGIALQYSSEPDMSGDLVITLNTLHVLDVVPTSMTHLAKTKEKALVIKTQVQMEHVARIPHRAEPSTTRNTWCHLGQGWALFGVDDEVFFICWEGATAAQGAFVSKIHSEEEHESELESLTSLRLYPPVKSDVLRLYASRMDPARPHHHMLGSKDGSVRASYLQLPFTSPYRMPSFVANRDGTSVVSKIIDTVDDVVKDALDSLSQENLPSQLSNNFSHIRRQSLSHRETSVRLVRHCSSWNLLDDTDENKTYYDNQVPVFVIQLGPLLHEHFIFSLRKVVVDNATASPFNQVLGWLSQSKDYFTAASVALDLLRDVDSLRDLRRAKEGVDFDNDRANLEGLLDGIFPLYAESTDSSDQAVPSPSQSVLTQLADMTVGCLLKGGLRMSRTLENFVRRDPNYDPGRACLMLVAATVSSLSHDSKTIKSVMGADYEWPSNGMIPTEDLVWPLRSLFQLGVARDYLPTILLLLNAAIPDEIRRRGRDGVADTSRESLEICTSIVSMIVASSSTELLLGLVDEATGKKYWSSLEHDTQLELSLISIDGAFPLLRQSEVRSWALSEMDKQILDSGSLVASNAPDLPSHWLRKLCEACLANAGCDLKYISPNASKQSERSDDNTADDGTQKHLETHRLAIEALAPSPGSGGLDFDVLIPALLVLAYRTVPWRDDSCLSTQSMLNAACYLAGRHRKEEPMFAFDGPNVMKQCALSGNVSAGANLIGGKNGLVLMCCDALIKGAGMSMDDAEDYILNDELAKSSAYRKMKHITKQPDQSPFELTDEHRSVLWLLDEYVLSIKTFGDFDTMHVRGKVDPVFAARSCLRTWFLLSWKETTQATAWLVDWLRQRLEIDQVRRKRLACSALTCALMWPTTDEIIDAGEIDATSDENLLANALKMESLFLVQLAQSSCGLVESLPPSFAQEVLRQVEAAEAGEKRKTSFQVDV